MTAGEDPACLRPGQMELYRAIDHHFWCNKNQQTKELGISTAQVATTAGKICCWLLCFRISLHPKAHLVPFWSNTWYRVAGGISQCPIQRPLSRYLLIESQEIFRESAICSIPNFPTSCPTARSTMDGSGVGVGDATEDGRSVTTVAAERYDFVLFVW